MMALPKSGRGFRSAIAITLILGWGTTLAEEGWVLGSWVNLRSAASTSGAVRGQLTTNTQLEIVGRDGTWCAVRVSPAVDGYLHCSLIGLTPLSLNQVGNSPGRAFWIAPSVGRFISYGSLLRTGPAYKRMYDKLQADELARIPPLPEFDAAKRIMQSGIVPKIETEIERGAPVDSEKMAYSELLKPKLIKTSLFRSQGDIVLASEGDADSFAAVTRSRISLHVDAPPRGYFARHYGPEITGITGFGDIGAAYLKFTPPMLRYSLLPNGLLSASHLSKQAGIGEHRDSVCGEHYTDANRSIGVPSNEWQGLELELKPANGFPRLKESIMPMATFVTAQPLTMKKVMIRSRAAQIRNFLKPMQDKSEQVLQITTIIPKVVLHEVDFDGDGEAEMLIWDTPSIGDMSGALNLHRNWYLNINGHWYAAGGMDVQECT